MALKIGLPWCASLCCRGLSLQACLLKRHFKLSYPFLQISGLRLLFSKSSRHENIDFDRQYRAAREAGPLQAGFNDKHSVFAAKAMEEVQLNVRASFNCPMQFSRTIQQLLSNTSISVEKSRQLLR